MWCYVCILWCTYVSMPVRSLPGRRSLRSTGTNRLLVPPVKRSTVGSRAFQSLTWNTLPEDVTSSQSEYTFHRQLKTWLFNKVFSSSDTDCILTFSLGLSVPALRRFCRLRTTICYDMKVIQFLCICSHSLELIASQRLFLWISNNFPRKHLKTFYFQSAFPGAP